MSIIANITSSGALELGKDEIINEEETINEDETLNQGKSLNQDETLNQEEIEFLKSVST